MATTQEELVIKVRTDGTVSVEKLNAELDKTNKKSKEAESGLASLGKAAAGAVAGFLGFQAVKQFLGDSIQASINLEKSMLSLKSVAKATGNDFQKVQSDIKKLGADGTLSIGGIAKQYGLLLQQGVKADQAFSFIEAGKKLATFRGITGNAEEDLGSFIKALQTGSQELAENLDPSLNGVIKRLGGMAAISQDAAKKTELLNTVIANGTALNADYEATLGGAAGAQAKLNTAFTELKQSVGQSVAPIFTGLAKGLASLANAAKDLPANITAAAAAFTLLAVALTPLIGPLGLVVAGFAALAANAYVSAQSMNELEREAKKVEDSLTNAKITGVQENIVKAEARRLDLMKQINLEAGKLTGVYADEYAASDKVNLSLVQRARLLTALQSEQRKIIAMTDEELGAEIARLNANKAIADRARAEAAMQGRGAGFVLPSAGQAAAIASYDADRLQKLLDEQSRRLNTNTGALKSNTAELDDMKKKVDKTTKTFDELDAQLNATLAAVRALGEVTNGVIQLVRSNRASGVLGGASTMIGGIGSGVGAAQQFYQASSTAASTAAYNQAILAGKGTTAATTAAGTAGAAGAATAGSLGLAATTFGIGAAAVGIGAAIFGAIEAADEEEAERIRRRREREEQARERAHQIELNRIKTVTALIKIQLDLELRLNNLERERRNYAIEIANLRATSQGQILRNQIAGASATMEESSAQLGLTGTNTEKQRRAQAILENEAKAQAAMERARVLIEEFKANPTGTRAWEIGQELKKLSNENAQYVPAGYRAGWVNISEIIDETKARSKEMGTAWVERRRREEADISLGAISTGMARSATSADSAQAFLDARLEKLGLRGELGTQKFRDALSKIDVQQRTAATTGQAYDATGDLRAVAEGLRQNLGIADLSNITQGELDKIGTTGQAFERYQLLLDVLGKIKDATESTAENTSPELVKARQRSFFDFARSGFVSNSIFQSLGVDGLAIQNPQSVSSLATNIGGAGVGSTSNLVNLTQQILAVQREQRDLLAGIYANTDSDAGTAGGAVLRDNVISIIGDVNARKIV